MTDQSSNRWAIEALYSVPIEKLELSVKAINVLKRYGVNSVGDCIDFYYHCRSGTVEVSHEFMTTMEGEVQEKLRAHGYWSLVEDIWS